MDQKGQGMNPKGLKIDIKELKSGGIWGYPFLYFVDFLAFFGGTPSPFFSEKIRQIVFDTLPCSENFFDM